MVRLQQRQRLHVGQDLLAATVLLKPKTELFSRAAVVWKQESRLLVHLR